MKPCVGGPGFTEEIFHALYHEIDRWDPVIELGSVGGNTAKLAERYVVYTVEYDPGALDRHAATYVYAPLVDGWYSRSCLERLLPAQYGLVLVCGPLGAVDNRCGITEHLDLFRPDACYFVPDVHLAPERALAVKLGTWAGRPVRWADEFALI